MVSRWSRLVSRWSRRPQAGIETNVFSDPTLAGVIDVAARRFDVSPLVHAEDFIFHYLLNCGMPRETAVQHYFESGRTSAEQADSIFKEHVARPPRTILDFACGYGCVTRHLHHVFPRATVTGCDVLDSAVEFVSRGLGVRAMRSSAIPEDFAFGGTFDLVIVLSLFTHLPERTFSRWLRRLARLATPGGLVLFTTHGRKSAPYFGNPVLGANGFWHEARREHHNLDPLHYGLTINTRDYCEICINEIRGIRLIDYREGMWWGHQDTYVIQREGRLTSSMRPISRLLTIPWRPR